MNRCALAKASVIILPTVCFTYSLMWSCEPMKCRCWYTQTACFKRFIGHGRHPQTSSIRRGRLLLTSNMELNIRDVQLALCGTAFRQIAPAKNVVTSWSFPKLLSSLASNLSIFMQRTNAWVFEGQSSLDVCDSPKAEARFCLDV